MNFEEFFDHEPDMITAFASSLLCVAIIMVPAELAVNT